MSREVMKNIFRIPVPLPNNPLRELNCYLIRGKDRNLLIDTGFCQDICREALLSGLKELGARREETDIVLTHLHSDHTGLLPDIASSESRVYIDNLDRDWLTRNTRFALEELENERFAAAGIPDEMILEASETHPGRNFAPDPDFDRYLPLTTGDVLEAGGYRLEALQTPGHTPSHLCLWMAEHQTMFTGDHVLFDITPNITRWPNLEDSLGHYLESLKMVRSYDVKLALPAHRSTGDFRARIDELLRHHEYRLSECLKVVREEPGLLPMDIAGRMTWRIRAKNWEEFPVSQKWFAVGEGLSHLERLMRIGLVREEKDGSLLRYYPAEK
jgi:glyoxylase-like metal-dependent hydrolase (beta-lactamase superfamily II)